MMGSASHCDALLLLVSPRRKQRAGVAPDSPAGTQPDGEPPVASRFRVLIAAESEVRLLVSVGPRRVELVTLENAHPVDDYLPCLALDGSELHAPRLKCQEVAQTIRD